MTGPSRARALRVLTLAAAWGLALGVQVTAAEDPPTAVPTIYKWVDANGIAHYTTELGRVPRSVRGSVRALGSAGARPADGFAARDATPRGSGASEAPTPEPTWDQGSAGAAAASPPAAASLPATSAGDSFAETDRPAELPHDEAEVLEATQTASAEAVASVAVEVDPARAGDLDVQIAALEAQIASDEDTLKGFLAAPAPADPGEIAYDRSFREVAEGLPKRLAELRTLQSERAQLDQP